MNWRPAFGAVALLGTATALAAASFWLPSAAWLVTPIIALVGAGMAFDYFALRREMQRVAATISAPATAGRDIPFDISIQINGFSTRRRRAVVRAETPLAANPYDWVATTEIGGGERAALHQTFRIPNRGRHKFGPIWVRWSGPLGMLDTQTTLSQFAEVDVLPEAYWTKERLAKDDASDQRLLDKLARAQRHGAGTEFESLSEFRLGDDPLRIDWRATARTNRLIVRRFQIEQHRDLFIVLDCGRLMGSGVASGTKLDCAVDAALMLGRTALAGGDRCGIGVFDDQVLGFLPPISGPNAMRSLIHCVYDRQPSFRESDFSRMFAELKSRQQKRSLVVILSDIVDEETTTRFRASLAHLGRRHVVLFAALRTPLLTRIIRLPIDSTQGAARHAVVYRLLRERERAIHSLSRQAVRVLDVEPLDLTVRLINQYVEIRRTNAL